MKKWLITLLVLFFAFPVVSAGITLDDISGRYNIGDDIKVGGYIQPNQDIIMEYLSIRLNCGNLFSSDLNPDFDSVDIERGGSYRFDKSLILPRDYKGTCSFEVSLGNEVQTSNTFEISEDLRGDIFANRKLFKLGEKLEITTDIMYLDNEKFNGRGTIYLILTDVSANNTYFNKTLKVSDGEVTPYIISLKDIPTGAYTLNFDVSDRNKNKDVFSLGNIIVTDKLSANIILSKQEYLPGENLEISGDVDSKDYIFSFNLDDVKYEERFEDTGFYYYIKLKDDIKSGSHALKFNINDEYGNHYEEEMDMVIIGVPRYLDVNVNEEGYLPEDTVEIFAAVYDQGGDIYEDTINLNVVSPKKIDLLDMGVSSGTVYGLGLEKHIAPGSYKILAKSTDFNEEIYFIVNELEKINAYYEDNRLKVSNEGNVPINDEITVNIEGSGYNFDIKLNPSEIESYDLREYIKKNGNYDLVVDFKGESSELSASIVDDRGAFEKFTGSVVGEGGVVGSWFIYLIIVLLIIIVLYLLLFRGPNNNRKAYERKMDYKEGQEKLKRRRAEAESKKPRKLFNAKDVNEKDAKQFRDDMVKKMKER